MTPSPTNGLERTSRLNCMNCEELLADFLDGVLSENQNAEVQAHLTECPACAEFAKDVAAAVALCERAAEVEVPPTLVPRILAEIKTGPSRVLVEASLAERIFGRWIRPVLQPRFAIGLAMALLSIAVIPEDWRSAAPSIISAAPAKIWTMAENHMYRVFDRTVKNYEDSVVVADVQDQLSAIRDQIDQWRDQAGTQAGEGARER